MSVEVTRAETTEVVAVRFWGGKARGFVVQMEVTEQEFAAWANVQVQEEKCEEVVTFGEWMSRQRAMGVEVKWDEPHRHNQMAREFENHRFGPMVEAAAFHRQRAKACARQTFRVAA